MTYTLKEITKETLNELMASDPKVTEAYQSIMHIKSNTYDCQKHSKYFTILDAKGNFVELLSVFFLPYGDKSVVYFTFDISNDNLITTALYLMEKYLANQRKDCDKILLTILNGTCNKTTLTLIDYDVDQFHYTKMLDTAQVLARPDNYAA